MKQCKGVISAGDQLTAEAGAEIIQAGGNAFDAVIAATFMSFAASSSISSAGGGGFMMAHTAKSKNLVYDFFVQTPIVKRKESEIDFYPISVDFGDKAQEFHIGPGSVATPGNIAGLFEIHNDLGSIPMTEIMAPVLERMKKGIKLHQQTKYQIDILTPILTKTENGKNIYLKNQDPLSMDDLYFLPQMMDVFDFLSRTGPREFYEGEIAHNMARLCEEQGGHLSYQDFKNYKVVKRKPLAFSFRNAKIFTNPPPNSGGSLIAFLLKIVEKVALNKGDFGKVKHLQTITEAIRLTDLTRKEKIINQEIEELQNMLFDIEYLKTVQQTFLKALHKSGNTTHVSVIDQKGNVASCTTSVGEGCGHFIPGTDIMLTNMLGEEDLNRHRKILLERSKYVFWRCPCSFSGCQRWISRSR